MEWLPLIREFGFPSVVAFAVCVAAWRALVWLAGLVKEYGNRAFGMVEVALQKHYEFLDVVKTAVQELALTIATTHKDIGEIKMDIQDIRQHLGMQK